MTVVRPRRPGDDELDQDDAGGRDGRLLSWAVDLATRSVDRGGGPFGAVVSLDGVVLGTGQNRVARDNDPTAHAEVVAIRRACAVAGTFSLAGATLHSSCEPCPMCLTAALWARVDRIVYAADRHDAARGGFDDLAFHELLRRDRATWSTPVLRLPTDGAEAPFEAWRAAAARVEY